MPESAGTGLIRPTHSTEVPRHTHRMLREQQQAGTTGRGPPGTHAYNAEIAAVIAAVSPARCPFTRSGRRFAPHRQAPTSIRTPPLRSLVLLRVLVIEDSPANMLLTVTILERAGQIP